MTSTASPMPGPDRATTSLLEGGVAPPASGRRRLRAAATGTFGPAALAAAVALLVALLHWKGVDQAAQAYRVAQVRAHGLALWDSGWYGGNYPLGYSLLFPLVGALIGLTATGCAAAAGATLAFDRLVTEHLGRPGRVGLARRPLGVWYFAVSQMLPVAIGQLPYLAGEALGLAALVAVSRRRRAWAGVLVALAAACSPLAAAFTVLAGLAWAYHDRGRRATIAITVGTATAVIAAGGLAFPGTGPFPFPFGALVVTLLACMLAATSLIPTTPAVRTAAALYAVASVVSFLVANPVGGNAPRLLASIGVPLAVCLATGGGARWEGLPARVDPGRWPLGPRWGRLLTVAVLAALACWQWGPGLQVVTSPRSDPAVAQSYYAPLVRQVLARSHGPTRVEIPPTKEHWEAAWVAPYVSLARGWERQLDIADNPLFYRPGPLDADAYEDWLVANGVTWVALPATTLDYAGKAEGGLLRTGEVHELHLVWSNRDWKLWRVKGSPGLVSGPAVLDQLGPGVINLTASAPGDVTVRVRYSSYTAISQGQACVAGGPPGWTIVRVDRPGQITLSESFIPDRSRCPPTP